MAKFKEQSENHWEFKCPGCDDVHYITEGIWHFNGDLNKPTVTPSLLVRSGHYVPGHGKDSCWCSYNEENPNDPAPFVCTVCHSFITDGKIQFLSDSTHKLAGQTVEIPEFEK